MITACRVAVMSMCGASCHGFAGRVLPHRVVLR
jgi:hypothetical protein